MSSNKNTAITSGIVISAVSQFEERYSSPDDGRFIFSYEITIENRTNASIQLLRRAWYIFDASGEHRNIEGKGVVGEQPLILPGQSFNYRSACDLKSPFGRMKGEYIMIDLADKRLINVLIPVFSLETPWILN